jgi:hypothetical protein
LKYTHNACTYLYPCASGYSHVLRARPKPETRSRASPCPSAWTACGFGAQAFYSASAFNANIGAWNTAAVTTLNQVCAAPGPGGAHYGGTRSAGASMRRGPLCTAAPPMRACVRTRAGTRLRGALGVGTAARRGGSMRVSEDVYICMFACGFYVHTYIIHLSVYVRIGRGDECVHQCAMVTDRLCECMRLRRAGVLLGEGVQRGHRRVEHRCRHHAVPSMRRLFGPAARTMAGRARPGLRCGAARCARRHRRCARACAHVQALACAGPWL